MSVIELPSSNGHGSTLPDDEQKRRAREAWHASGGSMSGRELAEMFGRPAKWGQRRRAEALSENAPSADTVAKATADTRARPTADKARTQPARPRTPARGKASVAVRRVKAAAVILVALVAAAASYSHMHDLALEAGEGQMAWVLPLSVDGLVVAATMTLLSNQRSVVAWLALLLGLGASLAANVAAAEPTVVGRLVAAWPPVALALSFELLLRQTRGDR